MIISCIGCYALLLGTDSKVKYISLLTNMTESHPLLAGMHTRLHVAMVILGHLFIAKLEDLSYPKTSDGRSSGNSKERWNRMAKKANKTTSTSKSRKLKERDSSRASLRAK